MALVIDELEATVAPDAGAAAPTTGGGGSEGQPPSDAHAVQTELVRIMERAERLRAD